LRGKLILRGNPGEGDYVKKIDLTLLSPWWWRKIMIRRRTKVMTRELRREE